MRPFVCLMVIPMLTPKLPTLALSYGMQKLLADSGEQLSADAVALAALQIYPEAQVREGLEDLCSRLVAKINKEPEQSGGEAPELKRTFGYELNAWVTTLTPDSVCLFLADYDPIKAHQLFWYVESELIDTALKDKLRFITLQQVCKYEASLYGFGGKYFEDSNGDTPDDTIDVSSPEAMQSLREFGFM